jgi:hypothetical protein
VNCYIVSERYKKSEHNRTLLFSHQRKTKTWRVSIKINTKINRSNQNIDSKPVWTVYTKQIENFNWTINETVETNEYTVHVTHDREQSRRVKSPAIFESYDLRLAENFTARNLRSTIMRNLAIGTVQLYMYIMSLIEIPIEIELCSCRPAVEGPHNGRYWFATKSSWPQMGSDEVCIIRGWSIFERVKAFVPDCWDEPPLFGIVEKRALIVSRHVYFRELFVDVLERGRTGAYYISDNTQSI